MLFSSDSVLVTGDIYACSIALRECSCYIGPDVVAQNKVVVAIDNYPAESESIDYQTSHNAEVRGNEQAAAKRVASVQLDSQVGHR